MAVLEELGTEIQILVNGIPLPEHAPVNESFAEVEHCVLKYLEVNEPTNFAMRMSAPGSIYGEHEGVHFSREIDGEKIGGFTLWKPETCSFSREYTHFHKEGRPMRGYFKFSSLTTSEDSDASGVRAMEQLRKVGEITFTVYPVYKVKGFSTHQAGRLPRSICDAPISEKALKGRAITHGVTYEERYEERPSLPIAKYPKGRCVEGHEPLATFIFRYRSNDLIKSGILERDPPPEPAQVTGLSNIKEMTTDQLQALVLRQQAELGEREHPMSQALKREASGEVENSRKRSRIPVETVDLTSD